MKLITKSYMTVNTYTLLDCYVYLLHLLFLKSSVIIILFPLTTICPIIVQSLLCLRSIYQLVSRNKYHIVVFILFSIVLTVYVLWCFDYYGFYTFLLLFILKFSSYFFNFIVDFIMLFMYHLFHSILEMFRQDTIKIH